ncbi:MAG: pilus assembly protein TadG-related protein [Chloroflexota bacterium]|nr:pilus assembly protein TadG-related protein [Chloroflexota bacterium]
MRRDQHGQVLPLAAVCMAILIGFAGVAVDVGRVWAERRYLQNAADAAALAGCDALIDGASDASAAQRAREIGTLNLGRSPAGGVATLTATTTYEPGQAGVPSALTRGVLVGSDGSVRVAIQSRIDTALARVVGVPTLDTEARAMCNTEAFRSLVPVVVRRYIRPPGPGAGFVDQVATAATSGQGQVDLVDPLLGYDIRTPASRAFPGPEFQFIGPQTKSTNMSSFFGFVAFDIRNYASGMIGRQYYNGVPPGSHPNQIKLKESQYFLTGYPGPPFPPARFPPDPNGQVGVITGLDAALTVRKLQSTYRVGDELIAGVYDGIVQEISGFSVSPPDRLTLPTTGITATGNNPVRFSVKRDPGFSGRLYFTMLGDDLAAVATPPRPTYDLITEPLPESAPAAGKMAAKFTPQGAFPDTKGTGLVINIRDIATNNIPAGIYTVWLKVDEGSPAVRSHLHDVPVYVGGAVRDFSLQNSTLHGQTNTAGGIINLPIEVYTGIGTQAWGTTSPVKLSVERHPLESTFPGSATLSTQFVVPSNLKRGTDATLSVDTAGLAPGAYRFVLRATGTNGASQPVTHLEEVTIEVGSGAAANDRHYVDITGFAVFQVTEIGANYVTVRAVSRIHATSEELELRPTRTSRLQAWN